MDIIKELQRKALEVQGRKSTVYPLPKVQVDQQRGVFVFRRQGEVEEIGESLEFYVLRKYGEYVYYDPEKDRITRRTTIEVNPKDCREINTGMSIDELKAADYEMVYIASFLGFAIRDGQVIPAVLQVKGAVLKSIIDYTTTDKEYARNRSTYVLVFSQLQKNKKGRVEYYTPVITRRPVTQQEATEILSQIDQTVNLFEQFRQEYNGNILTREEAEKLDEVAAMQAEEIDF